MKILALEKSARLGTPSLAEFDFQEFSHDLTELSNFHGITIISLGALSGTDSDDGVTYLAIWKHKPNG